MKEDIDYGYGDTAEPEAATTRLHKIATEQTTAFPTNTSQAKNMTEDSIDYGYGETAEPKAATTPEEDGDGERRPRLSFRKPPSERRLTGIHMAADDEEEDIPPPPRTRRGSKRISVKKGSAQQAANQVIRQTCMQSSCSDEGEKGLTAASF
jgi:hypothetical protein